MNIQTGSARTSLSERVIAFDLLHSVRLELLLDGGSLAACSHPKARALFRRMAHDHEVLYEEIASLIRRRGWRREPQADRWTALQLFHHVARPRESLSEQKTDVTGGSNRS